MIARATQTMYWPGMTASIRNTRYNCTHCNENAPSQSKEPYCTSPPPQYPFQQICMDYFEMNGHHYLSCVDRFSGWIMIYNFKERASSSKLVTICREIFATYGVSEEVSTDGGPQFTAQEFQNFIQTWGIKHRISSVNYPQSNGRAEIGVRTAKRIIAGNIDAEGSTDTNKVMKAVLQYRNTPIPELGLSPAQLLLHRQLRDSIPAHPTRYRLHKEWVTSAEEREKAFGRRNLRLQTEYNCHASPLPPLTVTSGVRINEKGKWEKTGRIVEALPNRQYRIRMDGSGRVTLRNRRFLRPTSCKGNNPIPSADGIDNRSEESNKPTTLEQSESQPPASVPETMIEDDDEIDPRDTPTPVVTRAGRAVRPRDILDL